VTRVLSGAVLVVIAVGVVWLAPWALFFLVAEALLLLGVREYAGLSRDTGLAVPAWLSGAAAAATCAGVAFGEGGSMATAAVLLGALVAVGTISLFRWDGRSGALASVAAAVFPSVYLGLPIGALVVIRTQHGAAGLFLVMLTVMISDTAQYYAGRTFGRRPLAPTISPKKTIEGAIGGFVFGAAAFVAIGARWLPDAAYGMPLRFALGLALVAAGIAGDLFESMLKRSAGVKDSGSLIPGHGGVLDRIDALLFAAPVYFVALVYL
jgi:phosphatidate cytidylyltransferase